MGQGFWPPTQKAREQRREVVSSLQIEMKDQVPTSQATCQILSPYHTASRNPGLESQEEGMAKGTVTRESYPLLHPSLPSLYPVLRLGNSNTPGNNSYSQQVLGFSHAPHAIRDFASSRPNNLAS